MSTKSKSQLQQELQKLQETKAKLLAAKTETPEKFTEKHQAKLDEVVEAIVDLEEQIELAEEETPAPAPAPTPAPAPVNAGYVPAKGTEKCVHLSIVRGRRFNPRTGKEESHPYNQIFSLGEFALFKANASLLGYSVIKVLHDPTGQAESMVVK